MTKQEIELKLEDLDGRSKEAKELKEQLEFLNDMDNIDEYKEEIIEQKYYEKEVEEEINNTDFNYTVPEEVYEKINKWYGRVKSDELDWLFKTYNKIFETNIEKCLCSGKVRRMIIKIKKTYEKERQ